MKPLDPKKAYSYVPALGACREQEAGFANPSDAYITNLTKMDDEDTWIGTIGALGGLLHFYLIRVHEVDGIQNGTCDPHGRLDDVSRIAGEGIFQTVTVPGLDGEFVMLAFSFGD